jgi:putative polyhydroxyalkanoate system protein
MADIDIRRSHDLGLKAARKAADQMAEDLGRKFGLTGGWTGNTHHFDRPGVAGSLHLTEKDLHLTVKLGFLLKAMRGPLEAAIVRELDQLFARHATAGAAKESSGKAKAGAKAPVSRRSGAGVRKGSG